MNPLTNVKNINKLNETELARGTVDKKSWHDMYKDSAWIFIGGLAYGMTEGDVLSVFSQYGEIVNINLIRDGKTGKIKGFCFLCYANQKSTILAVDNLNGIKLCGRTIRVDHVANYKPPKVHENDDDITKQLKSEGCAPKPIKIENPQTSKANPETTEKKNKKHKKEKKKHKKKHKHERNGSHEELKVKEERIDDGYIKHEFPIQERNPKRIDRDMYSTDSEDSEKSSPESENSNSDQLSRKEISRHKQKTRHSESSLKEKFDSPSKHRGNDHDFQKSYKTKQKERGESSSDSCQESVRQKKSNYQDDYYNSSSKRKSYKSDNVRKINHSDENQYRDHLASNDGYKSKHSSEQEHAKHKRRYDESCSESDVSDEPKLKATDKGKDRREKYWDEPKKSRENYSTSHRKSENSSRRDDADYKRKSRSERYS